jgi:hypothetical protein
MDKNTTGITWAKADYKDVKSLSRELQGVHTLLCFITPQSDPGNTSQKNLIDAAIKAKVKRYAPSEWASYVIQLSRLFAKAYTLGPGQVSNTCHGMLEKARSANTLQISTKMRRFVARQCGADS